MSLREQKKLLDGLKNFERSMSFQDKEAFKILMKRHIDEEEFDTLSMQRLRALYEKYYRERPKPDLDSIFKK